MLYAKSQLDLKKPRDKIVLQMGEDGDVLGIYSDKKSRKPKPKRNDSPDQLENKRLERLRELFFLIKNSLFEEDDSIYESYWQQVFQQYYSN